MVQLPHLRRHLVGAHGHPSLGTSEKTGKTPGRRRSGHLRQSNLIVCIPLSISAGVSAAEAASWGTPSAKNWAFPSTTTSASARRPSRAAIRGTSFPESRKAAFSTSPASSFQAVRASWKATTPPTTCSSKCRAPSSGISPPKGTPS